MSFSKYTLRLHAIKKEDPIKYWAIRWLRRIKWKKDRSDVDSDITVKYLINKYKQAKKKYPKLTTEPGLLWSVSVDRIDNNKHYKKGNIQIIPMFLNSAKSNFTMEEINAAIEEYYLITLK